MLTWFTQSSQKRNKVCHLPQKVCSVGKQCCGWGWQQFLTQYRHVFESTENASLCTKPVHSYPGSGTFIQQTDLSHSTSSKNNKTILQICFQFSFHILTLSILSTLYLLYLCTIFRCTVGCHKLGLYHCTMLFWGFPFFSCCLLLK